MKRDARATDPAWGAQSHRHFPQPYVRFIERKRDLQEHACVDLIQNGEVTEHGKARGYRSPEDALKRA